MSSGDFKNKGILISTAKMERNKKICLVIKPCMLPQGYEPLRSLPTHATL